METETKNQSALLGKHRLEALTDGIYSIAATLLVLELKLAPLPHGSTNEALTQALIEVAPKGLTWLLSFWVMAMFWLAQLRLYRLSASLDWSMVWVELVQLALISLLPFSTAVMGEHGRLPTAAVLYSANLLGIALGSWYRTAHFLAHPELHATILPGTVATALRRRASVLVAAATATLTLAFFFPAWNMLAMLPTVLLPRVAKL